MSDAASSRFTNRLAGEKSPYLRQHQHNPVDWFPWGEEAFDRARVEQKPIFLSIGYSTCHWCHVMAHESFENEAIARLLNRDFVPVKVDREERPDVDRVYMTYVQAATGHGGWPMSVWLTPDLKPFYGGTYFPPEDRWGRPGLATLLRALAQAWAHEREKLRADGERVVEALRQYAAGQNPNETSGDVSVVAGEAFDRCLGQLNESFDAEWGGFGGAPKFPRAAVFNFLFRVAAITRTDACLRPGSPTGRSAKGDQGCGGPAGNRKPDREDAENPAGIRDPQPATGNEAAKMATLTLRKMAEGGIHDHVGGGFHRYSVDEEWFVPHFEKMLYDQAQLAISYLEARQATNDGRHAWVARGIFEYVLHDLASPAGGFYSAEDADSPLPETATEGESRRAKGEAKTGQQAEGAFYIWTKKEIEQALGDGVATPTSPLDATKAARLPKEAELFCVHYGVMDGGNVPEARDPHGEFRGKNILRQRQSLAETAKQFGLEPPAAGRLLLACLTRLREWRARRRRPHLDDKILTAWNGLMISALAKGHQVLDTHDGRDGSPGWPADSTRPAVARCLQAAVRAAEFLRRELYDEQTGVLYRSYREGRGDIPGFAEDYAYLVQGLLDLYEASFDIRWLQWAERLQAKMDELFWDANAGGYFNSRADDPAIIARLKEDYDGAEPAPGSVAAGNLLRLDAMLGGSGAITLTPPNDAARATRFQGTGVMSHRERAVRCIEAFRRQWERAPHALPQMLCALALARQPPCAVVLAGDPRAADFRALAAVLHERLGPRRALLAADGGEGQRWLTKRLPYLAEMKPQEGRAAAYVCENHVCRPPVTTPSELRRLLES